MHVRVSGTWKRVNKAYVRVSGTWKQFLQSAVASSFSVSFSKSGATSTITSDPSIYTLGAGNSGGVRFENIVNTGSGQFRYSVNGGGNTAITEGMEIYLSNTNSVVLSATLLSSGNSVTFDIVDVDTGAVLENDAVLSRT